MAIWLKFKAYIIAFGAGLAALIGVYLYGRSSGSYREMQRQAEADREKARTIEDAADRVRRADGDNATPIERLSKHKRLRDLP